MTVEMWMGLGIVVAIIGFIMWRAGLSMQAKRNRKAGWSNDRIFIFQSKVFKLIFKFQRK